GGAEAMGLRQTLRFVNHDQQQIPRLVGWQYGSKTGQDFGLGVTPADYLVRSAGFAAYKVAWNIGPCRRAFFHIEAHQVAHFLGGFGLYHAFGELFGLSLVALEESRRDHSAAIHQR